MSQGSVKKATVVLILLALTGLGYVTGSYVKYIYTKSHAQTRVYTVSQIIDGDESIGIDENIKDELSNIIPKENINEQLYDNVTIASQINSFKEWLHSARYTDVILNIDSNTGIAEVTDSVITSDTEDGMEVYNVGNLKFLVTRETKIETDTPVSMKIVYAKNQESIEEPIKDYSILN